MDRFRIKPTNETEMLQMAGEALFDNDDETLRFLLHVNEGWLRTSPETQAMTTTLEAMLDACDD